MFSAEIKKNENPCLSEKSIKMAEKRQKCNVLFSILSDCIHYFFYSAICKAQVSIFNFLFQKQKKVLYYIVDIQENTILHILLMTI